MTIDDLTRFLFFDIETVRSTHTWEDLLEKWQHLWTQKAATFPEFKQGTATAEQLYLEKAGIFAEFAKIVCISFGRIDSFKNEKQETSYKISLKAIQNHDENQLLKETCTLLTSFFDRNINLLAGHNIKEFDIPFLARRLLVQSEPLPPQIQQLRGRSKFENKHLDTLELWRFGDYKNYTRLDLIAACLGIDSPKNDIDGSQVGEVYWSENNLARISDYCTSDVEATVQIALRLFGHNIIDHVERK